MSGAMLTSPGSIPVYHNPNNSSLLFPSNGNAESKRFVVKEMTAAIDSRLKHLTVNAPDWYVAFYHEKTPCGVASMVMM
jgi:hypothetical protein